MKKTIALILALVMVFALVACSTEKPAESPDPAVTGTPGTDDPGTDDPGTADELTWGLTPFEERQTLRLGFFTGSPLSYPYLFADKLGVFDALNIDLEYTCFTGGPAMMEANAEWDMASCGLGGICLALASYDFALVDVNDYEENMAIFAREGSAIAEDPTNPENWKGITAVYPAGTTGQTVLAQYLQDMGLSLTDLESVNMDNSNGLTGFNGGTGDVLVCWNAIALAAEDAGHVRVTDSGKLGLPFPCATFAQPSIMEDNFDLVATAVAVFHLAVEWCYESDENMAQAAAWYLEHCDEEGFLCNEDVAARSMNWYRGSTVDEFIALFTETSPDDAGLYTSRDLLQIEKDVLSGYDFFISEGKYTADDRIAMLDNERVDNSVALRVKEMLGK